MEPKESENTKKKEFKILAKAFKKKSKVDKMTILEPYKKDIYKLKFDKKASLGDIVSLFKQIGVKISKAQLRRFCAKGLSRK